jgi:hypothetical protein
MRSAGTSITSPQFAEGQRTFSLNERSPGTCIPVTNEMTDLQGIILPSPVCGPLLARPPADGTVRPCVSLPVHILGREPVYLTAFAAFG